MSKQNSSNKHMKETNTHKKKLARDMNRALQTELEAAAKEEQYLAKDRKRKLRDYYKKKKLNKKMAASSESEKLPDKHGVAKGANVVKRDAQGHILPGQHLYSPTQFKPGVSANPGGRPKKSIMDDWLREAMEEEITDFTRKKKKNGRPRKNHAGKILIRCLIRQAAAGHRGAMQLLFERIGGKPLQEIDAKVEAGPILTPEQRANRIKELLAKTGDFD